MPRRYTSFKDYLVISFVLKIDWFITNFKLNKYMEFLCCYK